MTDKRYKAYAILVNAIEATWAILKEDIARSGEGDVGYCGITNYTRHSEAIKQLRRYLKEIERVISSEEMKDT